LIWINPFFATGQPPASLNPGLGLKGSLHRFCGRVMQKSTKGVGAEVIVVFGKENKFMPSIIHNLRGHGNHRLLCLVAQVKIILQCGEYHLLLIGI
jgi:hypothetical protein